MISVCCFREEDSPVGLECVGDSIGHETDNEIDDDRIPYPVSCWALEDCLNKFVDASPMQETPPLNFVRRLDLAWLCCRRPVVEAKESLFGLLECDAKQPRDIPIQFFAWIASSGLVGTKERGCACVPYSNSWCRTALQHVSKPPPLSTNDQNTGVDKSTSDIFTPVIHWLDFRTISNFYLKSVAEIAHFLKSLLGASQHTSPWVSSDELIETDRAHRTLLSHSDCVIIVLPSPVSVKLADFRVSDICPSWSLYSIAYVRLPKLKSSGCSKAHYFPWNQMEPKMENTNDFERCVLYIYRRLPNREYLSSRSPETNAGASNGCLWESLVVVPFVEEEKTQSPIPFYEFRLVAPPYINPLTEFPQLKALIEPENLRIIQREAMLIPQWTAWPEQQHYNASGYDGAAPWHVFPLCHCFPADDASNLKWIARTAAYVPKTVALLKTILKDRLRTALFSRLDPESVLEAHTGW